MACAQIAALFSRAVPCIIHPAFGEFLDLSSAKALEQVKVVSHETNPQYIAFGKTIGDFAPHFIHNASVIASHSASNIRRTMSDEHVSSPWDH
ncbi:hypothetical protein N7539_007088 [Penicillium diatomitis]|uniref:Uncharacterized protein n=1 Tax=Penicillium diatomitis TaxID=2819901 RepID=A0A9X0BNI3_9EURO|nr:uncharacterized protein N7539_007088 [Penicillium diatomitis]KAJ5476944.1 hypothetical protein N7539_007088 [Penicillium diatomitis]